MTRMLLETAGSQQDRASGGAVHAAEDIPAGLLHQVYRWYQDGALVDAAGVLDYGTALACRVPPGSGWVGTLAFPRVCVSCAGSGVERMFRSTGILTTVILTCCCTHWRVSTSSSRG